MATENGNGTVTVVSGDTLYSIAKKYYSTYGYSSVKSYQDYLVEINGLSDANVITIGQVIKLTGSASGGGSSSSTSSKNSGNMVTITHFGLVSNKDDTLFVAWKWSKESQTKEYKVRWFRSWDLKGIAPYVEQTANQPYDSYSPPSEVVNSTNGKVSVSILPVADTYEVEGSDGKTTDVEYFTATWSTVTDDVRYYYGNRAPSETPSAPDVEIEDSKLTAYLDDIPNEIADDDSIEVEFEVCKMSEKSVITESWKLGTANIIANSASYAWTIEIGYEYKVRCRYVNDNGEGEWSGYSGGSGTKPSAPSGITSCKAISETEVYLTWTAGLNADTYEVQYTTETRYFDSPGNTQSITGIEGTGCYVTGLESGDEYLFRVRSVNDQGTSDWTDVAYVTIGTPPTAPTTWSSTTTVVAGEELTLYWMHNSEDGSSQTLAYVEVINETDGEDLSKEFNTANEEDDEKTSSMDIDTSGFTEGAEILWRVKTAGATRDYGEWSIQRTVMVYAQPSIAISAPSTLKSFPLEISCEAGPSSQIAVGYHVSIVSKSYYETIDSIGNPMIVNKGDEVYSKYINWGDNDVTFHLTPGDLDLENNVKYTITVTVSMDSGLVAEDSRDFTVSWEDELYSPNAELGYNKNNYTMTIRPYCEDENGDLVDNVQLSVYRREFNGSFTEIASGLKNKKATYVTDPHPALDYARYRIVAISDTTGSVSYYDIPAYPIGENAIIIQWDETWRTFESSEILQMNPPWTGSLLRLPWNIDISEDFDIDSSLVEYIGREHPVSYYGTQRGYSSTWNVEIPKSDKETLYGLRRLANWMGDAYVREPSGTGYWARIKPSFNVKHLAVVIPITLNITRVEGGA